MPQAKKLNPKLFCGDFSSNDDLRLSGSQVSLVVSYFTIFCVLHRTRRSGYATLYFCLLYICLTHLYFPPSTRFIFEVYHTKRFHRCLTLYSTRKVINFSAECLTALWFILKGNAALLGRVFPLSWVIFHTQLV